MISGKNTIGFKTSNKGTTTFKTFDPKKNTQTEWTFFEATKEEIDDAVNLAAEAFEVYKTISGKQKAEFLNTIANEIEALGEELIKTYCTESGLPEGRAMGERGRTMGQLRMFAKLLEEGSWVEAVIEKAQPNREPMPKSDIRKMLFPLGPVVVFGASNFPLAFSPVVVFPVAGVVLRSDFVIASSTPGMVFLVGSAPTAFGSTVISMFLTRVSEFSIMLT